ncbi:MAG: glycosyl hydrolase [Anaerolineae bacterium]|nr:glycosyl hydrolase [Anaerolineae bacterium]
MTRRRPVLFWAGALMVVMGSAAVVVGGLRTLPAPTKRIPAATEPVPTPTWTPEPIVPTRTPLVEATPLAAERTALPDAVATTAATTEPMSTYTPEAAAIPATARAVVQRADAAGEGSQPFVVPASERWRLGISLPYGAAGDYDLVALSVGWVMDWGAREMTSLRGDIDYAPTVRMKWGTLTPEAAALTRVALTRPGSIWLVSNEADVRWQDNVTPEVYAQLYHEAYRAIKAGDPTAVVAAGGIAQPSDLRLQYLDLVLRNYSDQFGVPLPAEAWHIHNYMLREERDSWGVDIPPGIADDRGAMYDISDSGNVEQFKAQIYTFRRWMASRGYGGQPLVVSEFGIPMPADYGYPAEVVASFLRETWRFFLNATDAALGDPSDEGRLVQRWCWFSMAYPDYPTGDLVDMGTGAWTPLGQAWLLMVAD